jgi:hypothetical protein
LSFEFEDFFWRILNENRLWQHMQALRHLHRNSETLSSNLKPKTSEIVEQISDISLNPFHCGNLPAEPFYPTSIKLFPSKLSSIQLKLLKYIEFTSKRIPNPTKLTFHWPATRFNSPKARQTFDSLPTPWSGLFVAWKLLGMIHVCFGDASNFYF